MNDDAKPNSKEAISITPEEFYVARLEEYCHSFKCAVIDLSLKLPDKEIFLRYITRLEVGDVEYIVGLLHQCWTYLNPGRLFLQPTKPGKLEETFNKFEEGLDGYNRFQEEVLKADITGASLVYSRIINECGLLTFYSHHLRELYDISKTVCSRFNLNLQENFLIDYTLHTSLSKPQLSAAFKVIARYGFLNVADKSAFLAIFDTTINARPKKLMWLDINEKNGEASVASLLVAFRCIVEMTVQYKTILCRCFADAKGNAITPDQLKVRDSKTLAKFEEEIRAVLS